VSAELLEGTKKDLVSHEVPKTFCLSDLTHTSALEHSE